VQQLPVLLAVSAFNKCGKDTNRVDTKWRFQFFAKYDYRFLSDVIIAIIASFFA
jgi:hypothetical protein